ncbi:MAG: hypothetical protein IJ371_05260 [Clostridia bacterium]|nr:hypothetical protein [Clostridia bacterium]
MTRTEIQAEIERLYYKLTWIKGKNKKEQIGQIIAEINRLQAIYDAMVDANEYDGRDYYYD